MGSEAVCTATFKGRTAKGKARLETEVLQFRSPDLRLDVPFKQVTRAAAARGVLRVTFADGIVAFSIGDAAKRWAEKILHPPTRAQKIGVKPAWVASAIEVDDQSFLDELAASVARLSVGRPASGSDAIFFGASDASHLAALPRLKAALKPDGALWVIRPKGRPEISEAAVMRAGRAAGLVDVKVVGFSATHTAEKFVVPVAARRRR
jgi:hypothetical protein